MLKINILTCAGFFYLILILFSCKKESPDSYRVSGKLDNVQGEYFYVSHEAKDSIIIDTVSINEKGEFSFEGKTDTLSIISLYFNQNTKSTFVLVNKKWNIEIKGDVEYPDLIEINGGSVNDDLTGFKDKNKELLITRTDILNQAENGVSNTDSTRTQNYLSELKNTNFELSNVAAEYIRANPDKIASVMLLNLFFKNESSISRLDENLRLLRGRAADFPMTFELQSFRDKVKQSSVGARAPQFQTRDIKGDTIKLQDFRNKYVLLSFAATTCDICKEEKSDAIATYSKLKNKNIEFISIVKDEEIIPISKNITDSVKWKIIPVEGGWGAKLFNDYYIREIPYNILISPTGGILERDLHILDLPEKLEKLPQSNKK
ncbi:MAG: DUF4369 domain-containing protein [Prevotella sp.]|jgi:thiol-disulfide isomerase/thioredoxin|nr:DUF4369 domain-containing protein [Prevotella sp.]